jgi:hypothetical protein
MKASVRKVDPRIAPRPGDCWRYVVSTTYAGLVVGFRATQWEALVEALRLLRGGTP